MRRANRLTSSSDYERVVGGVRVSAPEFVLYHSAREATEPPRIGLTVGRRLGGAVVRNRTRRKLREALRPLLHRFVACDVVLVARPPAVDAGVADLRRAIEDAARRAGLLTADEEGTT